MEHARKLALVDPRQLEHEYLQQQQQRHVEYKDVQKLPDIRAKSDLSLDMKPILDDDTISDDVKAKLYRRTLDRYLRITNALPLTETAVTINPLQLPPLRRKVLPSPHEGRKTTKKKQKGGGGSSNSNSSKGAGEKEKEEEENVVVAITDSHVAKKE